MDCKEEKKLLKHELYEKKLEISRLNSTLRDSEFNYKLVTDLNKELNKKIKILDYEINKLNDKEERKILKHELYEKNFEISRLNSTLRDSEFNYKLVTDLNKELNKKIKILDYEINKLMEQNDELNYQIKSIQIKENYNNYLEKTILKYNLNLS